MKRIALLCLSVAFLVSFSACSKSPEEQFASFMKEYVQIALDNDGDCEASAKKLNKLIDDKGEEVSKQLVTLVENAMKDGADFDKDKFEKMVDVPEDQKERLNNLKCKDDPAFQEASQKMAKTVLAPLMTAMMKAAFAGMADGNKE